MADELTKAGYVGGQINKFAKYGDVEIEQGINPTDNDFMKAVEGADDWPRGIKRDEDDQNGILTKSNPAWPNKK